MDKLWTVEYSCSQGFFHFDRLKETIDSNRRSVAYNQPRDWQVIHVCGSFEECAEFADAWLKAGNCPNYNILNHIV